MAIDQGIFNLLRRVQAEDDEARRQEIMAESNEELGQHFRRNLDELEELAFDLLNLAWADAYETDIVRQVIEVKTVGLGDADFFESDLRGMRAYWQGKGGQIRSDILRYERHQMPREEMVAAIDMHQDQVATDFWGSFAKLSTQAQEKMRLLPVERLIELVQAGIATSPYFASFAAATLTDAQVDTVLDAVSLKSGGQVTLLGTPVAIRKLSRVGLDFGQNIQEDIFRTGRIAVYKGYPVVQVENHENFDGNFVLPNDELWLVGKKAGRLTYFGAQAKVQQLRDKSFMLRWETARDAGMMLFGSNKGYIGRIKLT